MNLKNIFGSQFLKFIFLLLILWLPAAIFAELVVLKTGETLDGQIISRSKEYIIMNVKGKNLTIFYNQIKSINSQPVTVNSEGYKVGLPKQEPQEKTRLPHIYQSDRKTPPSLERLETPKAKIDLNATIANYSKVIQNDPNSALAYVGRANVYVEKGDFEQAINDYNKAIEIMPNLVEPYIYRASLLQTLGNLDKAISDYSKAIEIKPNEVLTYIYRGDVYIAKGELDKATADYSKAIELNPEYGGAYSGLARVYFKKQQYDKSWENVRKAQDLGWKINPSFLEQLTKATK